MADAMQPAMDTAQTVWGGHRTRRTHLRRWFSTAPCRHRCGGFSGDPSKLRGRADVLR